MNTDKEKLDRQWEEIRKCLQNISRETKTPAPTSNTDYFSILVSSMVCVGIYTTVSFVFECIWNMFT